MTRAIRPYRVRMPLQGLGATQVPGYSLPMASDNTIVYLLGGLLAAGLIGGFMARPHVEEAGRRARRSAGKKHGYGTMLAFGVVCGLGGYFYGKYGAGF